MSENNTNDNVKSFILDPLSVIIKLAIISNKPVGTKIMIQNNVTNIKTHDSGQDNDYNPGF